MATTAPPCPITPAWVDLAPVLALYAPELLDPITHEPIPGPATDLWALAICESTWVLSTLAAGKVHPEQCWVEDYQTRGSCKLTLRRQPVANIDRLEVLRQCGRQISELPITDWCLISTQTIDLCCGHAGVGYSPGMGYGYPGEPMRRCGCQDEVVRVHYKIGTTLPPGTQAKVAWLADQYVRASTGQKCSLPDRVTNVNRQGVSWTLLDPMEFLDKRFTGMGVLDSWLAVVRVAYPSAEYIDPLRSNRLFSQQVSCDPATAGPFLHTVFGGAPPSPFGEGFQQGPFGQPGTTEPFDIPDQYLHV